MIVGLSTYDIELMFVESDQESSNGTPVKQSTASSKPKVVSLKKKDSMYLSVRLVYPV